ncbi:MAG: sulfate ABC transporter ATP-binding protein [Candidatus Aminicenantes bacterium]|nr:sulfate ABC transporter ATP-binding protein [Candidatus Aminicenantes bacterium]NIM80984.1 sulfate ABC transporter ATP-binding protein [Candidatus Aminicenantes bacterium]NIN20364.1 sulfate ABC transporter ATP-binding protein [Candidatus Aminicenantes bacterium]NIN44137.1 sulfate ABC transporter ATP-binding protein [Candidatus Aminicenantes bacterium]NIN86955.1 sulfate ABC transporter ATP-binding protein [Candidatus Aminicenantes bacterium]
MSGIQVEHINKTFGNFIAVNDVSFTVNKGELAVLVGPSGSGKSTILRIIAGLEKPESGNIFLTDEDVTHYQAQKRNIGFVFQHYALFKHMTVKKNIAFGMKIRRMLNHVIEKKVSQLIDLVKLQGYERHYPSQLSGGQRQRVALARALAPEPRILLLDEPFGSLDAKVRDNLANWLRELHNQIAITTILVTHDQKEAIEIADKIIVINRGKVEQIGTAREVYEQPETKFVSSFIGQTNVITGSVKGDHIYLGDTIIPIPISPPSPLPSGSEPVVLLVRPEDVIISKNKETSTSSSLKGTIKHIHYRGNFYKIDINIGANGIYLESSVGKQDFLDQDLEVGDEIYTWFRDFQFFKAPEGEKEIRRKMSQLGYIE